MLAIIGTRPRQPARNPGPARRSRVFDFLLLSGNNSCPRALWIMEYNNKKDVLFETHTHARWGYGKDQRAHCEPFVFLIAHARGEEGSVVISPRKPESIAHPLAHEGGFSRPWPAAWRAGQ